MLCSGPAMASAAAIPLWYLLLPQQGIESVHAPYTNILVNLGSAQYWSEDHSSSYL